MILVRKFGGTSIGTPEQMKSVFRIINDGSQQLIVLSAIAGITNQLEKIASLIYKREDESARLEIDKMSDTYRQFIDELLSTAKYKKEAYATIDQRNDYLKGFTRKMFNLLQEKALLADGELISTAIFQLYLQEQEHTSALIQALNFMRIDKDLEPDEFYISENLKKHTMFLENVII